MAGLVGTAPRKGLWKLFPRMPVLNPQGCQWDCGYGQLGKVYGEEKGLLAVPSPASTSGTSKPTRVSVPLAECRVFPHYHVKIQAVL